MKIKREKRSKMSERKYKIIITGDRKDYDDLSELANHPERGIYLDTQYFDYPEDVEKICETYEGLFYQLFRNDKKIDSGVVTLDFILDAMSEYL